MPFLGSLNLPCPSYHNPASFIIEVACGEYGDNTKKLVAAIENGKQDIREGKFPLQKDEKLNNASYTAAETKDKNDTSNIQEKFNNVNDVNGCDKNNLLPKNAINDISKESKSCLLYTEIIQ